MDTNKQISKQCRRGKLGVVVWNGREIDMWTTLENKRYIKKKFGVILTIVYALYLKA